MAWARSVVVGLALVALAGCGGESDAAPQEATEAAEQTPSRMDRAYDFCLEQISDQLKAPATAQFSERDADSEAAEGDRRFLFSGTVDSENGFGALIRSEWACDIHWSPSAGFVADVAAVD